MKLLLQLKSWQLFIMLPPTSLLILVAVSVIGNLLELEILKIVLAFIGSLVAIIAYYGWIWSAGTTMFSISGAKNKRNIFKTTLLISFILAFILVPILRTAGIDPNIALVLGAVAFTGFITSIYLVATSIQMAEKQVFGTKNNLILDFLRIWLLPIGIWTLQPRISRLITTNKETQTL